MRLNSDERFEAEGGNEFREWSLNDVTSPGLAARAPRGPTSAERGGLVIGAVDERPQCRCRIGGCAHGLVGQDELAQLRGGSTPPTGAPAPL